MKNKCGLCGKSKKLTQTPCCWQWICDDQENYVIFSYARNSCSRNHDRYTLCSFHYHNEHEWDWKDCKKCLESFDTEDYVYLWTNEYNFEKLKNPPKYDPTICHKCWDIIIRSEWWYSVLCKEFSCFKCSNDIFKQVNSEIKLKEINSIEDAFNVLDNQMYWIPYEAIEYLFNHKPNKKITDKILFALNNAYDENEFYDAVLCSYYPTPIWYAIVAENHLSLDLIDPVIKLFTTTYNDWDFLDEQWLYLICKLAEKYPKETIEKIKNEIDKLLKKKSKLPYLYLFEAFYYADINKHKDWLLKTLENKNHFWIDSFISLIWNLRIKEALPILYKFLSKNNFDTHFTKCEIEEAIEQIETWILKYPDISKPYNQTRENWKDHYKNFENIFEKDEDNSEEDEDFDEFDDDDDDDENFDYDFDIETKKKHHVLIVDKVWRNDPCTCWSWKKYKKCCLI